MSVGPFGDEQFDHEHVVSPWRLRPLTPALVEIDYAAVMASAPRLRIWSASSWPAPGFTIEDNLIDVVRHDQEHRRRDALTYSILDDADSAEPPDEVLGCVYVMTLRTAAQSRSAVLSDALSENAATVCARLWLRSERRHDEPRCITAITEWWARLCGPTSQLWWQVPSGLSDQVDGLVSSGYEIVGTADSPAERWLVLRRAASPETAAT